MSDEETRTEEELIKEYYDITRKIIKKFTLYDTSKIPFYSGLADNYCLRVAPNVSLAQALLELRGTNPIPSYRILQRTLFVAGMLFAYENPSFKDLFLRPMKTTILDDMQKEALKKSKHKKMLLSG